jgi:hypothetical protein
MPNERNTENIVRDILKENKTRYRKVKIYEQKTDNPLIEKLLQNASKKGEGKGKPEFIITFDEIKDLIIVIECKADVKKHESKEKDKFSEYAVDGVLLYSSYLSKEFNVISIAVSGETKRELRVSNFLQLQNLNYSGLESKDILSFEDYIKLFRKNPQKERQDIDNLLKYSRKLHNDLRDFAKLSEPEKPLLISAILIALEDRSFRASYKEETRAVDLAKSMISSIEKVLEKAKIPENKRVNMLQPYSFIPVHPELVKEKSREGKKVSILYDLVRDMDENVKTFLDEYEHFDVLGQFYGEFLRYTGGDKKGLGIVLTPRHITELFSEIADVKKDDVVFDNCCGTAGFLISAMRKMIDDANGDSKEIEKIKKERLIGIEQNPQMFALGCANMILRGDGKANIYRGDCFEVTPIIKQKHKCSIGFLNPPYSQKGEGLNELEYVLNCLEGLEKNSLCVAIVPMSCAINKDLIKKRILEKHTLKAVMSMPDELFYPVGIITCIMVFRAGIPHNKNIESWFGFWKDDGFEKTKHNGRVDKNLKWTGIKEKWLDMFRNEKEIIGFSVKHKVDWDYEWCAEAYMKTDYSTIKEEDFVKEMKKYILFTNLNSK